MQQTHRLLRETLDHGLSLDPEKTALVCRGRSLTHAELSRAADRFAALLASLDLAPGDRVGLFMKNSVDLPALYLACFRAGFAAVPLNTRYKADEAAYGLNLTEAKAALADQELAPILEEAAGSCPKLEHRLVVREGRVFTPEGDEPDVPAHADAPRPEISPDDPAAILFTSGSTGRPKGVIHTQQTLGRHLAHKIDNQDLQQDEVGLVGTQIVHVGGMLGVLLPSLAVGGTCVMIDEFEPGEYIRLLKRHQPTLLMLLPTELLEVLEHPHAQDADFSHIRSMLVAGDAVPHHVYELYRNLVGADLMEGFGMTECEGFCLQPRHEPKKPGSMGKPVPGMRIKLTDGDGREVELGQPGEMRIQGDSVCAGYWRNPEATAESFVDGWFKTGDMVRKDEDGFYHFVSRLKELIVRGGSNISPAEVEDVLDDHPDVEVSGVVGFPDPHWGQVVGAFVEPAQDGPHPSEEDLRAFCAKRLGNYMIPERWVFVDHLPKNAVGKVDRHGLHVLADKKRRTEA